jgi:uncharacterized protein YlaI
MSATECGCYNCTKERVEARHRTPKALSWHPDLMRMFLCPKCGNKRCPHATDHRLECTGSNEPGQKGSLYE